MRDGVPRRSCYPLLFSLISNMRLEMVQDGDIQTVVTNGRLKGSHVACGLALISMALSQVE